LYDPCNWAIKNCDGTTNPIECDFIREWFIDWGDGITNLYKRASSDEQGLPDRIAHKYTRNGWFHVKYLLKTDQGCEDTVSRWIKIPGPRPKFEFTTKFGNEVTICAGDSIQFTNLTDSASTSADWTWFFGDGAIDNVKDQFVSHTYENAGRFFVFLEQYDSLVVPPNVRKFCPATYPDTPSQAAFIVNVLPRDSVRGLIVKPMICIGDSNTFVDLSDTVFKSYKWRFENLSNGQVDTITVTDSIYTRQFWSPGVYRVTHLAEYDPQRPNPWCPTIMADMFFTVDSVIADFSIDSSGKPDFSFTRTDINGTQWRWGFGHQNDITQTLPNVFIENLKSGDKTVQWSYDSSNVYYVCLEVTNATGCKDTICKPVVVDLFVYLANVFTPGDNNGKNDTYRVPIQGQDLFEIRIFNRWGERVFYSEDPKVQWNGRVNNDGPEVPSGTYFYQVTYRFKGKDKINKVNGSVNLIRGN
jgi:gliding motility-associated-like protein